MLPIPARIRTWYCFYGRVPDEVILSQILTLGFSKRVVLNSCHLNRHVVLSAYGVFCSRVDLTKDDLMWALGAGNQIGGEVVAVK